MSSRKTSLHARLQSFKTSLPDCLLPVLPTPLGATCMAMLWQYRQSEWWSAERLQAHQLEQARLLLQHAQNTVPWYQLQLLEADFNQPLSRQQWLGLPILVRQDLQDNAEQLRSAAPPASHGEAIAFQSSGSTGTPVRGISNDVDKLYSHVSIIRDHLWHQRDFSARLAAIRPGVPRRRYGDWGSPVNAVFVTGPLVTLPIHTPLSEQVAWLQEEDPTYLLSHPSNLKGLALHCLEHAIQLPALRQVRSFGEVVPADLPDLCQQAWQASLVDAYSSRETGTLALQCPESGHYHLQAENCLVEVINDQGQPCQPGDTGRVLVTTLHNFHMPLIRYAIGDYAEVGPACTCGRGLPVLTRILGRQRNLARLPDGSRMAVTLSSASYYDVVPIQQLQLIQDHPDHILARVVARQPLTPAQQRDLVAELQRTLHHPYAIDIQQVPEIPRAGHGKFEEFICQVMD